jgi:SAM-dependent methyltransferase
MTKTAQRTVSAVTKPPTIRPNPAGWLTTLTTGGRGDGDGDGKGVDGGWFGGESLWSMARSYANGFCMLPSDLPFIVSTHPRGDAPPPGIDYVAFMARKPQTDYLDPYREAVKHFGGGFEATLWRSEDAQRLRFDVMIDMVDMDGCTIADVGCGRGDFALRLVERAVDFKRFVGFDAMPAMIEAAQQRQIERCEFRAADPLAEPGHLAHARADWICFSGTLNTMDEKTARRFVASAFDAARRGVVFNFLSDRCARQWRRQRLGPARRFNTLKWVDWALARSTRVQFRQDYLDGHDATIALAHTPEE